MVIATIDPAKDVDGLHPTNLGRLLAGEPGVVPCTPSGCHRERGSGIAGRPSTENPGDAARLLLALGNGLLWPLVSVKLTSSSATRSTPVRP